MKTILMFQAKPFRMIRTIGQLRTKQDMTKRDFGTCPHCGQLMMVRHGVKMSPKKILLLDVIERISRDGARITIAQLAELFYPDKPAYRGKLAIKVHINQINVMLEKTDFIIRSQRPDGYQLERRCAPYFPYNPDNPAHSGWTRGADIS